MSATRRGLAFRDLGRLFRHGALHSGDGALLECFLAEGDESAFDAIGDTPAPLAVVALAAASGSSFWGSKSNGS
jgi:hypothetical protein